MARWPDTSPTTDADGWTEHYGCYSKRFGGHFTVSVSPSTNREKPGYRVRVGDVTLKTMSADLIAGQRRGIRLLQKMLAEASEDARKTATALGLG